MNQTIVPVILCGGSGTRLWPASREEHPKQFLQLVDDYSLLQNTMLRGCRISAARACNVVTVTLKDLSKKVRTQLAAIDPLATQHILCEPSARNTAAAIAYAALYVSRIFGKDAIMWVLPADHYIGNENEMTQAFQHALRASAEGLLVTFGINPTRPETGYGYIRLGSAMPGGTVYKADSFVEKPNVDTAKMYMAAGNYLWNSGMFLFSASTLLAEYETFAPDILRKVEAAMEGTHSPVEASAPEYAQIPSEPFDKAIMEKSAKVAVIPCNPAWSDIGSWESLWEIRQKDGDGNVIEGNAVCHGTRDCLIQAQKRLVACAGVEDLVVIETGDALLVAKRSDAESMRSLVKALKNSGYAEMAQSIPANLPVTPIAITPAAELAS